MMSICAKAVTQEATTFKYVPKKYQTYAMCIEAVLHGENMLQYISKSLLTEEIYLTSLKNSPWGE